jgi:DNA-binding PadR family transcriptional regulator
MRTIGEKSDGAWRPGAGTVYPLLRGMAKDGLVKQLASGEKESRKAYSLTQKGGLELEEMQRHIASAGRREQAMMRFFVDVLPATAFATMVVRRGREMGDILREKIVEVPQPERDGILREMRVVFENQLSWINSQLMPKARLVSRKKQT